MARSARSPRTQTASPRVRRGSWLLLALCALAFLPRGAAAAPPAAGVGTGWQQAETTDVVVHLQSDDPNAAAAFVTAYGAAMQTAVDELRLVFGLGALPAKLAVYAYADQPTFAAAQAAAPRREVAGITVAADTAAGDLSLYWPAFVQLSATDAENQLRHGFSHLLTARATGNKLPWGFDEGIAQYVERPVTANLARIAGLLQSANQRGAVASWFDVNSANAVVEPTLAGAESYAIVAYLIDTYKLAPLGQFLAGLKTAASWREALRTAYGRDPDAIEKQWKDALPKWTAGNWRKNLIAGFDLAPARALLQQANYAAALAALEPALALYDQLDGPAVLQDAKTMARQCEIGTQAETLMDQTQQALQNHAYDRAASLIAQAKLQFAQLPAEQQPTDSLATYDALATQGLTASAQLDRATQLSHSWRDYPDARSSARAAGSAYAALGDADGASRAQGVLDDLDKRQRRIVLLLAALGVLTAAWLGLWLWARGPAELAWG